MDSSVHIPVLLHEIIEALIAPHSLDDSAISSSRSARVEIALSSANVAGVSSSQKNIPVYLDGTLGGAGHALAIAKALKGKLDIIGFDRDPHAIERAEKSLLGKAEHVILVNESYRNLDKVLDTHQIPNVDMILLDLGFSSDELDHSGRGFSFQKDEPLLMTLGDPATYLFTAKSIVNGWAEEDIANVIFGYGEDRYARRIARHIVAYRSKKQIETSGELAEIVKGAVPRFGYSKTHPATKTFQALRIAVNDELGALKEGLAKGYERLSIGGRMAIISFHSLEDRIVKDFYKQKGLEGAVILTKKPLTPGPQELAENPRSRSAKLRIIEKR